MRFFRRFIKFSIIYNKTDYCLCKFIIGKIPLYLLAIENVDFTTLFLNLSKIQRFEQFRGLLFVYIYCLINTPLFTSRQKRRFYTLFLDLSKIQCFEQNIGSLVVQVDH